MTAAAALSRTAASATGAVDHEDRYFGSIPSWTGAGALIGVLAAAISFRVYLILSTDFPLNDGALFHQFVLAIAKAFPGLPETVAFNGLDIPFAYPPLSFWIAALVTKTGINAIEIVRVMPIVVNIACVLLFALLLLRTGHSRLFTAVALLFFCTRLRSFEWLIMGGGLSRGLGALFFLATLLAVLPAFGERRATVAWRGMLWAGLAVAGAVMSHLEWGLLAAASVVMAAAFRSANVSTFVRSSLCAGTVSLFLIAPWLLSVASSHGLEPFLAASRSSERQLDTITGLAIHLARTAVTNPFILLGALAFVRRGHLFWVGLLPLIIVLTPRHSETALSLPISVLAATGAFTFFSLLQRATRKPPVAFAATALAVVALSGFRVYRDLPAAQETLEPLGASRQAAMAWVAQRHRTAPYAVVTARPWVTDRTAEWFPTLTQATSVTTVQGTEWLPEGEFQRRKDLADALKSSNDCESLIRATAAYGKVDFVWAELGVPCFRQAGYSAMHANRDVTIFRAPSPDRSLLTAPRP